MSYGNSVLISEEAPIKENGMKHRTWQEAFEADIKELTETLSHCKPPVFILRDKIKLFKTSKGHYGWVCFENESDRHAFEMRECPDYLNDFPAWMKMKRRNEDALSRR